jgi:hypothetical protein
LPVPLCLIFPAAERIAATYSSVAVTTPTNRGSLRPGRIVTVFSGDGDGAHSATFPAAVKLRIPKAISSIIIDATIKNIEFLPPFYPRRNVIFSLSRNAIFP